MTQWSNRTDYAETFGHLGEVRSVPGSPVSVIVRPVGATGYVDGMLPPPYVWLDDEGLMGLAAAHPELVTITGVLAPGTTPGREAPVRPYKDHFVLDPDRPPRPLSARTRAHIRRGERRWSVDPSAPPSPGVVAALFRELVSRRGLGSTQHDHPPEHFEQLLSIDGIRAVGAYDGSRWGAMAVVADGPEGAHVLHAVTGDLGLRTDAGPVLMSHLVNEHHATGVPLFIGGVPDRDPGGMTRFKQRWSNSSRTVHLVTIVIRPEVSRRLSADDAESATFFPAYRAR